MKTYLIKNARVVNEGRIFDADILLKKGKIEKIGSDISDKSAEIIDASGKLVMPGVIDDQVHFREPGLTHKATIYTEARAAVAGGITSFMEMPNTVPKTFTNELQEDKNDIATRTSLANYSFYIGASNSNLDEVLKTDTSRVCGVKVFMGSSTGNMLVDDPLTLENIFSKSPMLIATHCEDEATIRRNTEKFRNLHGDDARPFIHPIIRTAEACYLSSSMAVKLAKRFGTRLHILHISTEIETALFESKPLAEKKITSEACIHHMWFDDQDYETKGNWIKWNPAVKSAADRNAVLQAVIDGKIDVIATDHAPHTIEEKSKKYFDAPSGGPLVQHALAAMLELHRKGKISL